MRSGSISAPLYFSIDPLCSADDLSLFMLCSMSVEQDLPVMEDSLAGYPPTVSPDQLANLIFNIKDWQITHGMQLKYGPDVESVSSTPIGVSVFPTPFPRVLFEQAQELQPIYNKLYAAISEDEEWLYKVLRGCVLCLFAIAYSIQLTIPSLGE